MPFQSEKQRRFLHANHPEIAKRWEKEYANGGISNHFRKKFFTGALADTQQGQAMSPGTSASGGLRHTPSGNGGGGGPKPHSGPTFAEIEAQKKAKALADAKAEAELAAAKHKAWIDRKDKKKKKVDYSKTLKQSDIPVIGNLLDFKDQWDKHAMFTEGLSFQGPKNYHSLGALDFMTKFSDRFDISKDKAKSLAKSYQNITELTKALAKKDYSITDALKTAEHDAALNALGIDAYGTDNALIDEYAGLTEAGTKKYSALANGGILDINESEEIISDDGNDIELTAYNAAFDDPNDLSTGVRTLFMKKGGQAIGGGIIHGEPRGDRTGFWDPGGKSPGTSSTGGQRESGRERGIREAATKPTSFTTGDASVAEDIAAADRKRKAELKNLVATGPGSDEEKYSDYTAKEASMLGGYTDTKRGQLYTDRTRTELSEAKRIQQEKLKKMGIGKLGGLGVTLLAMLAIQVPLGDALKALPKTLSLGKKDLANLIKYSLPVMKAQKEHLKALDEYKTALLGQVDINNPNEMKSKIGTNISDITNEIKELTKKPEEDDTKGDGPEVPQVVPVHEEIESYAQSDYYMSPWERMKANQAKRAMLVAKGIIQENPIVDETVTDITMEANRGGLANLFRVKNQ